MFFQCKRPGAIVLAFLISFLIVAFSLPVLSETEGHLSATYAYNPIDSLIGLSGDYQRDFGRGSLEADGSLQHGDITEGDASLAVAIDAGPIQIVPFITHQAIRTSNWGHVFDGGLKGNWPIRHYDIAIGIFGRASQAFVPLQTGTRNPITGEVHWDTATLLNFHDLGILNALIEAGFSWFFLDIQLASIFDVSNRRFHQLITDVTAAWDMPFGFQFSVVGQHIAQAGHFGGSQFNIQTAWGYKF